MVKERGVTVSLQWFSLHSSKKHFVNNFEIDFNQWRIWGGAMGAIAPPPPKAGKKNKKEGKEEKRKRKERKKGKVNKQNK